MMRNNKKSSVRPFLLRNCAPTLCARPAAKMFLQSAILFVVLSGRSKDSPHISLTVSAGGDERPSHNPLFRTILSKWIAHVTFHFDREAMDAVRISECSVRPFDKSSVIYLHCINLSTEKFTPVTSFACMEICCFLGTSAFQVIWP